MRDGWVWSMIALNLLTAWRRHTRDYYKGVPSGLTELKLSTADDGTQKTELRRRNSEDIQGRLALRG